MRYVFMFFALILALGIGWINAPTEIRQGAKTITKKHLPAAIFAAALTIAMLAFAFFTNGKVI